MSEIIIIKKKGCLDRKAYKNLTKEEKDIISRDFINHSESEQTKEYEFIDWIVELGGRYAFCRDGILNRYFYEDSIKKSKKQIKNAKVLKKKIKKNGKSIL